MNFFSRQLQRINPQDKDFITSHTVPAPRDIVWRYHTRSGAITRLTPGASPLVPVQQSESLRDGVTIFDLPVGSWVAQHDPDEYVEGETFADYCTTPVLGNLSGWKHVHHFVANPDETTRITDTITSRAPQTFLEGTFAYRQHQLIEDIKHLKTAAQWQHLSASTTAGRPPAFEPTPLTIAVSGTSGLVGANLCSLLEVAGHSVIRLVRGEPSGGERQWNPNDPAADLLDGVDVLVHIAGAPIGGRFTDEHKQAVRDSRVGPTRKLAELCAKTESVKTMVCASAVGYYGHNRDDVAAESAPQGEGFLADVVADWEADCQPARDGGVRVVNIRTGLVLGGNAPLLKTLANLTRTGLNGPLGDGRQYFAWIALDDLTDIYHRAILDDRLEGPINAVGPERVTNAEFTKILGSVLHRPTLVPVPKSAPALLLGEQGAEELAMASQNVVPATLQDHGHQFRYSTAESALRHELLKEKLVEAK